MGKKMKRNFVKSMDSDGFYSWEELDIPVDADTLSYCKRKYYKVLLIYEVSKKWELVDAFKEETFL